MAQLDILSQCDEIERRDNHRGKILTMLEGGPRTTAELLQVTHRFGARIHELRKAGYKIRCQHDRSTGESVYRMEA